MSKTWYLFFILMIALTGLMVLINYETGMKAVNITLDSFKEMVLIIPPIKECPEKAVTFVEDEDEPIGGRIVIDDEKCTGCGLCVNICCGHCIEMK